MVVDVEARLAEPADLAGAVRVWQLANAARGKVPDEDRCARVRTKLVEADALPVVAVSAAETVGMALAEPGRELPELCHISMVFVHPEHWGERIGVRLLDTIAECAARRGHTVLQVWTGQANERAQRLYVRAGFRPTGRIEHLPAGEPILHFARPVILV
jgi:GNAT superfamily N-acetyltransferase